LNNQLIYILSALGAIASLLIYTVSNQTRDALIYVQVPLAASATALLPIYEKISKKPLPKTLNFLVLIQIILSSFLGSALKFYHLVPFWDKIMHTSFGVLAAALFYHMLSPKLLLNFLSVMGAASLWEVFEFVCDKLFGGDAQRVYSSLKSGINPVDDTMIDIIVTAIGVFIYFVFKRQNKPHRW
jgi:hypothetical protein